MLASHGVAHVLNSWSRMPPLDEQLALPGVLPAPFCRGACTAETGRTYQDAVDTFQPYDRIRGNPGLRRASPTRSCGAWKARKLYAYVNNRVEGNSPKTIEAILDILARYPFEKL